MTVTAISLGVTMALAASVGVALVARLSGRRTPLLTFVISLLMIVGFAFQIAVPGTMEAFQRDAHAIMAGQWERLFTALFIQDGGWAGFGSNLAGVVIVGALTEQLVSRPVWIGLYFLTALCTELIALRWQPVGGGNSIAWMALAGALSVLALRQGGGPSLSVRGGASLLIGGMLSVLGNIHGPAILLGALLAWGIAIWFPNAIRANRTTQNDCGR